MTSYPVWFSGTFVLNKYIKFRDLSLNRSREIPLEAASCGIFDSFFRYNFRPEVDHDVISGVAVDTVGMDVPVKFGDSRSNGFQYIQGANFVSNQTNELDEANPNFT